jgi:hypothetical protein
MDEYRHFWTPAETLSKEFKSFVPQLVVIVAIFHAIEDALSSRVERDPRPSVLYGHVEVWVDDLTGCMTLATLRTRVLLILDQQVRASQADEVWKATGGLMRPAVMAGLHRDPSEFPDIHIFEGELRPRLWMTIVEMDLATSLIYGMPIMLHDGNYTCKPPSNLDDLDLFDGMTELPLPKTLEEVTDSIFQIVLAASLSLRFQAMSHSRTQAENIQKLIHSLETYMWHLPLKLYLKDGTKEDLGQLFGIVLLNFQIRKVLTHLYRSSFSQTEFATRTTTAGLQSSLSVLSYQKLFESDGSAPMTDNQASFDFLSDYSPSNIYGDL